MHAQSLAPSDGGIGLPDLRDGPRIPQSRPLPPIAPAAPSKTVLATSAYFSEGSAPISKGILWRVFSDQQDISGNYPLVAETQDAQALFTLDPGGYVIHATYGLANATRHILLGTNAASADIVLNAGAIRLNAKVDEQAINPADVTFSLVRIEGGIEQEVLENAKADEIIRLTAGTYQIISNYGTANARMQVELTVEPGRMTDAVINHKAAPIRLMLTQQSSGMIPADASWSVLTPGGDIVTTAEVGLAEVILAEGDYVAVAQHGGQNLQKEFTVRSGQPAEISITVP